MLARTAQLEDAQRASMTLEIEERRRVERELRSAEERFRNLVEDPPAVVYRRQVAASDDEPRPLVREAEIEELLLHRDRMAGRPDADEPTAPARPRSR